MGPTQYRAGPEEESSGRVQYLMAVGESFSNKDICGRSRKQLNGEDEGQMLQDQNKITAGG